MKRAKRRVRVARRQALLAEVSQRAAMRGLADALAEEDRSSILAERSRELTRTYGGRSQAQDAGALQQNARFAGALASLAGNAEAARADARQQAEWQAQALGQAQTRARLQSERFENAVSAFRAERDGREFDLSSSAFDARTGRRSGGLARALHKNGRPSPEDENPNLRTVS
ncbi:MAG: hypothetical protein HRT64_01060 [Erythrobacter sp.]|nr:hypothetical protein [Erythrobacter sp.]